MSLRDQLLALLSTPAARAASESDIRRSAEQLLGLPAQVERMRAEMDAAREVIADGAGEAGPRVSFHGRGLFSLSKLRRRRDRLARRLIHVQQRSAAAPESMVAFDLAEVSALQTAVALFDAAIALGEGQPHPVHCPECGDLEGRAWRRHAEIELGDDDAVRCATDEQLRRALTQKLEDQAHAIDVFAELAAAGDLDGIRMHYEHYKAAPDLSVEVPHG